MSQSSLSYILSQEIHSAFDVVGIGEHPIILQPAKNADFGDFQINGVMGAAKKKQAKSACACRTSGRGTCKQYHHRQGRSRRAWFH